MADRRIQFEGKTYSFPADATDDEISEQLAAIHDQPDFSLSHGSIGPPEPGLGGYVNRLLAKVRTGLQGGGRPDAAVEFIGGAPLGGLKLLHGVTQLPSHPIKGANEIVRGGMQAAALPTVVLAPGAIPSALPYAAGGMAVSKGAEYLGADPDTSEFLGNLAMGGTAARGPIVRGAGRFLRLADKLPEAPTSDLLPRSVNFASKLYNAGRTGASSVGRSMSRFGRPTPPNIFPGDDTGIVEPELPTPVKPSGQSHYNDVVDQGERNRLLDAIQHDEPRPMRDPVRPDESEHFDDTTVPEGVGPEMTTTKLTGPVRRPPQLPSRMYHGTTADRVGGILSEGLLTNEEGYGPYVTPDKGIAEHASRAQASMQEGSDAPWQTAHEPQNFGVRRAILDLDIDKSHLVPDESMEPGSSYEVPRALPTNAVQGISYHPPHELPESPLTHTSAHGHPPGGPESIPTPESNLLLRAIKSAPGWPENGLPNKPWDVLHAESELPDALATDPYNRPPNRSVQTPGYTGPERRGTPRMPITPGLGPSGQYGGNPFHDLPPALPPAPTMREVPDIFRSPTGATPEDMPLSNINYDLDWVKQTLSENIRGEGTRTKGPVTLSNDEGTFEGPHDIIDGYHRIVQAMQEGKPSIQAIDKYGYPFRDPNIEPIPLGPSSLDRPGLAETSAASDPTGDADALTQARQELPNGTLSDHLQRAAQIAAQRRSQR